jgi:hypothetical protein
LQAKREKVELAFNLPRPADVVDPLGEEDEAGLRIP